VNEKLFFNVKLAIFQLYHGMNKLHFIMRWWCSFWLNQHIAPLGHVILIPSQPIFGLTH